MKAVSSGAGALLRRWWIVLLALSASIAAAAVLTARQQPLFRASASLVVAPNSELRDPNLLLRSLDTLERRTIVATLAKIPMAPDTRISAAAALGSNLQALRGYVIRASVQPFTNVVRIEVTGPDPGQAAELANAVADATKTTARSMYRIFSMRPLARALPAGMPFYPNPRRNYLVATVIGLALGLLVAVLPDLRRLRIWASDAG